MEDVAPLLRAHAAAVDAALAALASALGEARGALAAEGFDATFALRFVLSNNSAEEAGENMGKTVRWRRESASWLASRPGEARPAEFAKVCAEIERYVVADYHRETKEGSPLYIVRAGVSNTAALIESCKEEDIVRWMLWRRELGFQKCDRLTRETGKMHRMTVVNDLNHLSLLNGQDKRFRAVLSKTSKLSEVYYPQLLGKAVLINLPRVFSAIFAGFKLVMSKRLLAKITLCPGITLSEDVARCPFASKHLNLDDLPTFLGGRCRCKPGCVSGVPNDQTEHVCRRGGDGMAQCTVAARDKHDVFVEVDAGDGVRYSVVVEERGVEVSVVLREADGGERTLARPVKVKAEDGVYEGAVKAPGKGTVILRFDNTYSWLNPKRIRYACSHESAETLPASE